MEKEVYRTIGKYKILTLSLMLIFSISVIANVKQMSQVSSLKREVDRRMVVNKFSSWVILETRAEYITHYFAETGHYWSEVIVYELGGE